MSDFHDTDIEVPATLRVDNKTALREVGVRFRGMSSYMMVPAGYKRSLNISIDAVNQKQNWQGIRTLNLLNSHEDPTYLRVPPRVKLAGTVGQSKAHAASGVGEGSVQDAKAPQPSHPAAAKDGKSRGHQVAMVARTT